MKKISLKIAAFLVILLSTMIFFLIFPTKEKPKKEAPGYPAEWAWFQRTFPYGKADKHVYRDALLQRKNMENVLRKGASVQWEFAGPENISGRITDIEYNPQNPQIMYAGAATGGVFKSEDGGANWQPVFDQQAFLSIGDIAVDPVNPDIIYVGTGEANGGHNNFPGGGMYKSVDAGQSWEFIGLGETISIGRVLVDPQNPQKIVVAAVGSYFEPNPERGIYISENGGDSWTQSLFITDSTGAIDVVMDPQNPQFMIAAMWERVRRPVYKDQSHLYGKTSGLWRTEDGGANWQPLSNGLPDAQSVNVGRIGLALHSKDTRVLYALYNDGSRISGLYRSDDDGLSWQETGGLYELLDGANTFSWFFGQVRVHPNNPDMVFVLDVSFMRSQDGGKTWPIRYGYGGLDHLHVDHHALAFHPNNPDTIISGNDGGINISGDGGTTWKSSPSMPISQFYEIGLDYTNPERLYGGTQDNNTIRTSTGALNDWQSILGGDGFYVIVDPTNPDIVYAEWQFGGLYKINMSSGSYTSLVSTEMSDEPTNWSTPVVMDPQNSSVLYYGTNRIWRTENQGSSWTAVSPDLTRGLQDTRVGTITTMAVAPSNSQVIYAGTADGQVWVSTNYGAQWTKISETLPFRWVTRVIVDPKDPAIVYATYSGLKWAEAQPHIFRSIDFGATWQDISAGLPDAPVNAFAVDPEDSEMIFAGSDVGAFVSFNSGQTWQVAGSGLPIVVINDMKIHPVTRELVVGTHGRSMYKLDINLLTGIEAPKPVAGEFRLHQNYPNPFNPTTTINYSVPLLGGARGGFVVNLTIYNTLGQKVRTLVNERQEAGKHSVMFNATGLASGVYYYKLSAGSFVQMRKMLLLK